MDAMAGEDQAEQKPTIIEPADTANDAKICVLVNFPSGSSEPC